jgi:hypothetical protein
VTWYKLELNLRAQVQSHKKRWRSVAIINGNHAEMSFYRFDPFHLRNRESGGPNVREIQHKTKGPPNRSDWRPGSHRRHVTLQKVKSLYSLRKTLILLFTHILYYLKWHFFYWFFFFDNWYENLFYTHYVS